MVVHLLLLLVLALITTPTGHQLGSVILTIGEAKRSEPVELAEFKSETSTEDLITDVESMSELAVELDMVDLFDSDVEVPELAEAVDLTFGEGDISEVAPRMFGGRSGPLKETLLTIYGGTPETQQAVKLGLEWLKRNQRTDGSWSLRGPYRDGSYVENSSGATAMALLAFLGDGHTHKDGEYAEVVEKGFKYLIRQQDRTGFFARKARSYQRMYAQAQATIAVCELYGMTKDSWVRQPAELAIEFAVKAQSSSGGWRYEPRRDSDTSMTGWYVMALKSGESSGLPVEPSSFAFVNEYLDTASSYDGAAYGYLAHGNPTLSMTAEGLLCRIYTGWRHDNPALQRGVVALLDSPISMQGTGRLLLVLCDPIDAPLRRRSVAGVEQRHEASAAREPSQRGERGGQLAAAVGRLGRDDRTVVRDLSVVVLLGSLLPTHAAVSRSRQVAIDCFPPGSESTGRGS